MRPSRCASFAPRGPAARRAMWLVPLVLAAASAPALAEELGHRAEPLQAAANVLAHAEVTVIYGNNSGKGIDPKLAHIKELKQPPFSAYNSYELLDQGKLALALQSPAHMKLPDGGDLKVLLEGVEEKKDEAKRFVIKASLKKANDKDFLPVLQVKAKQGAMFFVAGPKFKDGILVLGIKIQ